MEGPPAPSHRGFEALRRIDDADRELACPRYRSEEGERLFSTFAACGCNSRSSRFR
jgi:hypothetical protein